MSSNDQVRGPARDEQAALRERLVAWFADGQHDYLTEEESADSLLALLGSPAEVAAHFYGRAQALFIQNGRLRLALEGLVLATRGDAFSLDSSGALWSAMGVAEHELSLACPSCNGAGYIEAGDHQVACDCVDPS